MKKILLLSLALCATTGAFPRDHARAASAATLCASCGIVQGVHAEKRKGQGGAAGIVGGAVVGGLLGHQVGGGTGRTLATVGGAAAGGYVGNEVQKQVNSTTTWVTTVRMRDGSIRRFEQAGRPAWQAGTAVRADGHALRRA